MTKLKDINWNQVYYFYEVARKLSMKEAAEITGVSIPTVSEQIKRLEVLLDTPLFHRRPRRLELTTEGEILYKHAQKMFESGLRFLDVVSPTAIGGYPVRVGIQETFAVGPAMEFLIQYFDSFSPFGTVNTYRETTSERLFERINNGEIDWAISLTQPTSPRLEYGRVSSSEISFCVSSEKLSQYKSHAELFAALPLARSRCDDQVNKLVSDHLQSEDIFVEEAIESDHWDLCLELAQKGKCITLVAKSSGDAPAPGLATIGERVGLQTFNVGSPIIIPSYAVWRQSNGRMIAIRKLIELLEATNKGARSQRAGSLPGGLGSKDLIELPHFHDDDFTEKTL
jgi:DNA-binding transcriptional LysR family regulator